MNYWVVPAIAGKVQKGISHVEMLVCSEMNLSPDRLRERSKKRELVEARQMVMVIMREHYKMTCVAIGKYFEMDHSTVVVAIQRIKDIIHTEERTRNLYQSLLVKLNITMKK